jgi:phage tail sheath gpL-like
MGYIDQPKKTINIVRSAEVPITEEHRVLVVGQLPNAGSYTAAPGELYYDAPNTDADINTIFGDASHVSGLLRNFRAINKVSPVDVYPFAGTGTASTATIAFTGAATAAGSYDIIVGSKYLCSASVDIPDLTTANDAAVAVDAALSPLVTKLPFDVSEATGTVTLTARMGGTIAEDFDIELRGTVPGLTATVTYWSGGAGDPATPGTDVVDAIVGRRYQTIIWPAAYPVANMVTEMDSRFNADVGVFDGVMVQTHVATLANVKDYIDDYNSQSFAVLWNKAINTDVTNLYHVGGAIIEMPDVITAKFAALRALRLTDGSNIAPYMSTSSPLDQFGGVSLASLPYFNTIVPAISTPINTEFPNFEDIEEATSGGASVIGPNSAFNTTILGEMVTTYLVDPVSGDPDTSYKFLNTVDTISAIREIVVRKCAARYSQTRLTDGYLIPGRDMANENSIRAFLNEIYDELAELALVQAGSDAKQDFNSGLVVTVDVAGQKVTISMQPLLVTQIRAIIGTISINTGGN